MSRPPDLSTKQDKERLRAAARRARAGVTGLARHRAADAIAGQAITLPLPPGLVIGCYWSVGTELSTEPLIRALLAMGRTVGLPRTMAPAAALRFFRWRAHEPLTSDILGFPSPRDGVELIPDALFIPLVGFDRSGGRIGQGAGFYDRTLAQLRRTKPDVLTIGVAFACQELAEVPVEAHDQPLDYILTEEGLITARTASDGANPFDLQTASL